MKYIYILFTLCVITIVAGVLYSKKTIRSETSSLQEVVSQTISTKYHTSLNSVVVETTMLTDMFAKGSVRFTDELGGAIWFAAKTEKGWELVSDGQGPMSCDRANGYDFPKEFVPSCIDIHKGNTLTIR